MLPNHPAAISSPTREWLRKLAAILEATRIVSPASSQNSSGGGTDPSTPNGEMGRKMLH